MWSVLYVYWWKEGVLERDVSWGCEGQGAGNTVATLTVAAFCWGSANYPVCSLFTAFLWGADHKIVEQKVSGNARRVVTTHQCPRQGGPQRVPKTQGTTNPRPSSLYHTRSLPLLYVSVHYWTDENLLYRNIHQHPSSMFLALEQMKQLRCAAVYKIF